MTTLLQDFRYALRTLIGSPPSPWSRWSRSRSGSANTAVFGIVNAVLLKPLSLLASVEMPREHFVHECLVTDVTRLGLLSVAVEHVRVDADRDEPPRLLTHRRPAQALHRA
jgi:hypothetical protein